MPRKNTPTIEIKNRWYEFINSLTKPTTFFPDFPWGQHLNNIKPNISLYIKQSYCDIRYWVNKYDRAIVLISQDDDNPSMSITNACEDICTVFYRHQRLNPNNIRWFESYTCHTYPVNGSQDIGFSEIKFSLQNNGILYSPKWQFYSKERFKTELFLPF